MTDRIAEIEERLSEKSCECQAYGICLPEWASDVSDLLAELKSKDAECDRLREMLLKCEPALFALITLYPDREGEVCKEIRGIRSSVLAELEGK